MKSINSNQTQLKTLFFGLLCLLAGVVCFAKGYSSPSNSATAAITSGERQGVSPPCRCSVADDTFQPQFTSLTPRYVTKRIADLEVGEEVVAKDPESGEVTTKRVANVFRKVSDHLRILQVRNPRTDELQTIETTDDHPFWVAARSQWIDAKDLKVGDRLDDVDGGTAILESTSRELHPDGIPVFNFEVEDFHTYFVRAHGSRGPPVLTHHTECGEFLTIINVSPTNSIGLPGTGVFGDGVAEFVTFYHGTSTSGARSIRENGIDASYFRRRNDFGAGFYMSESLDVANTRAMQMFGTDSSIVSFQVRRSELAELDQLSFSSPSESWQDFVRFHRQVLPVDLAHGGKLFDMVSGPMWRNVAPGGFGSSRKIVDHWPFPMDNQVSIHTERAIKLFTDRIVR